MIFIEEKNRVVVVGGEDESGNMLDSCEIISLKDN
jgi:N-acetylneuraminic acid mutarotase